MGASYAVAAARIYGVFSWQMRGERRRAPQWGHKNEVCVCMCEKQFSHSSFFWLLIEVPQLRHTGGNMISAIDSTSFFAIRRMIFSTDLIYLYISIKVKGERSKAKGEGREVKDKRIKPRRKGKSKKI